MPIYLDNNATTAPAPEVIAEMNRYLTEFYGNPSSVHRFGQESRRAIDIARGRIGELIGANESELMFTGGGTEAVNTAIRSLYGSRAPRRRIIISTVEHSATRELVRRMAREGAEVIEIEVDGEGLLNLAALESALDDQTALLSLIWANNETGVIFPMEKIAGLCRAKGVPLHVDATQSAGKIAVDARGLGAEMMTIAPHKLHGPKGVGVLYARRGVRMRPLVVGGPQERERRGGTENVPGIAGAGVAAMLAKTHLPEMARVAGLRDRLERAILSQISQTSVNGSVEHRLPNTTNISFRALEADAIVVALSEKNVCISAGAACSSGSLEPSHVLKAMHLEEPVAHGGIRFSLSRYTTEQDIHGALVVLPGVIERLRAVMPTA